MTAHTATNRVSEADRPSFTSVARRTTLAGMVALAFAVATVDTGTAVADFVDAAEAEQTIR